MERSWRARERGQTADFDALHDGVPDWLWSSLWDWFIDAVGRICSNYARTSPADVIRILERGMRKDLASESVQEYGLYEMRELFRKDADLFLDSLNELLPLLSNSGGRDKVENLDVILHHGGSLWTADSRSDVPQLTRRVESAVQEAAAATMASRGKAAQHLRKAWHDVYGRQPDASDGYREAIRAVEAVAQPVVIPKDAKATLGKMIAALRTKPSKWKATLGHSDGSDAQVLHVAGMMDSIWKGQHDRHGSADESQPLDVSLPEAEAAVAIAVALVHLFNSGAIASA